MSNFTYKPTNSLYKIAKLVKNTDLAIVQGGQGAGKTVAIFMLLIDLHNRTFKETTVASAQLSKLKGTAILDMLKILKDWNLYDDRRWNRSDYIYTFANGGFIEFIGLDKADVGKGRRRDYVFINESNKITLQNFTDITARAKKVICDYNPDARFFLHDLQTKSNFINLTYLDNKFLPQKEIDNIINYKTRGYNIDGTILSEFWANKWRVYGLGEVGSVEGRIYFWDKIDYSEFTKIQARSYYGVDWGAVDPFAVVECKWDDGTLYVHELNYDSENKIRQSLTSTQNAQLNASNREGLVSYMFKQFKIPYNASIICDNNRPNKITSVRDSGWSEAYGIGAKSKLLDRINTNQQINIIFTNTSKNIDYEQMNYRYEVDKFGNQLERPEDKNNHTIDAISYVIQGLFNRGIIRIR